MPLQIRRGTTAERLSITPVVGELIYDTDVGTIYVGDGVTAGGVNALIAGVLTEEEAVDAVAAALVSGQHQGITFSYNATSDFENRIDAAVDLTAYSGTISATSVKAQLLADDDTVVFDPVNKTISISSLTAGLVLSQGNVVPGSNAAFDIGTSSLRYRELFLTNSGLNLGDARITATGSAINLPAGSTVGGTPIGAGSGISGDGVVEGANYKINILANDTSSIMVNSDTGQFIGTLNGNVIGNVVGDVTAGTVFVNSLICENIIASDSSVINVNNVMRFASDVFSDQNFVGNFEGSITGLVGNLNNIGVDTISSLSSNEVSIDTTLSVTGRIVTDTFFDGPLQGDVTSGIINTSLLNADEGSIATLFVQSIASNDSSSIAFQNILVAQTDVYVEGDLFANTIVGNLTGTFLGNSTGDVIGNLIGNVVSDVDGRVLVSGEAGIISNGPITITNGTFTSTTDSGYGGNPGMRIGEPTDLTSTSFVWFAPDGVPPIYINSIAGDFDSMAKIVFGGHGNSFIAPTTPSPGDYIGAIAFNAFEPNSQFYNPAGLITFKLDDNGVVNSTNNNGKLEILIEGGNGGLDIKYLTFDSKGRLAINQPTAAATVDINGVMRLVKQTAAPDTPVEGMIAVADGTTWDPASKGGSTSYPVYYDGANWTALF